MWKFLSNWVWDSERSENYKSSLIFMSFNNDGTGEELMYSTDDDKYDNNRHEHYYTLTARWHITFSKDGTKPITLYNIFLQGYYPTETAVEGHQMYLYHNESDNEHEICLCDNYGTPEYHGDRFTTERVYSLPTAEAIYADGTPYTGSSSGSGGSSGGGSSYSNTETITCSLCNGSGKCRYCGGKGYSGTSTFNTKCFLCKGSGKCTSCDGHGYKEVTVNPNGGGSSSGGNSSGGGSSSGTKCKYCQGSGKCSNYVNSAYNKYYCLGSGDCQYCSGDGYYWFASNEVMCANCDIPGHDNTPGNGKCSYCGGSGKCSHCKGTGYQ